MLIFCSYARRNRRDAGELAALLKPLDHEVWFDDSLHGGDDWWTTILRKIEECDAFLTVVSRDSLASVACQRELRWALDLSKPVLPVAVEKLTGALPHALSVRHIIDFSEQTARATMALAAAVSSLQPAPHIPSPRPEPPPAPLSYLTELTDLVASPPRLLDQDQQRRILDQVQPALRSADVEEREGARAILDSLNRRGDLFADVRDRTSTLLSVGVGASLSGGVGASSGSDTTSGPMRPPIPPPPGAQISQPRPPPVPPPTPPGVVKRKRSKVVSVLATIGAIFVALVLLAYCAVPGDERCYTNPYGVTWCG